MWWIFDAAVFGAGYVASVYSWQTIRPWAIGAEAEIVKLNARLQALRAKNG